MGVGGKGRPLKRAHNMSCKLHFLKTFAGLRVACGTVYCAAPAATTLVVSTTASGLA